MGIYSPVTRPSDGKTIRLDKEEAEQSEINFNAKKTVEVVDFLIQRIDYDSNGLPEYMGWALPGTTNSADGWFIKKNTISGTQITEVNFANGSTDFNQVWNDRTGGSYS